MRRKQQHPVKLSTVTVDHGVVVVVVAGTPSNSPNKTVPSLRFERSIPTRSVVSELVVAYAAFAVTMVVVTRIGEKKKARMTATRDN